MTENQYCFEKQLKNVANGFFRVLQYHYYFWKIQETIQGFYTADFWKISDIWRLRFQNTQDSLTTDE